MKFAIVVFLVFAFIIGSGVFAILGRFDIATFCLVLIMFVQQCSDSGRLHRMAKRQHVG